MKKNKLIAIAFIAFGLANLTTSCTKDDKEPADSAAIIATAEDLAQAACINEDILNQLKGYIAIAEKGGLPALKAMLENGPASGIIITMDKPDWVTFPKTITIDFGTQGFVGPGGNKMTGKLMIFVSNKMDVPNSFCRLTFENFAVNAVKVVGTNTLTFKGVTSTFHPYWTFNAQNTMTRLDGKTVVLNSDLTREILDMNGTPTNLLDDMYSIKGSANGTNALGKSYTMVIAENNPLIMDGAWLYFTKGSITLTSESQTAVIDFGNGAKDNKATVTTNGKTKEITLKI